MTCPDCNKPACDGCGMLSLCDAVIENRKAAGWYRLYGCHNKPRPTAATSHVAQSGWCHYIERGAPVRMPILTVIPHVMSTDCKYDKAGTDAGCAGCEHGRAPEGSN